MHTGSVWGAGEGSKTGPMTARRVQQLTCASATAPIRLQRPPSFPHAHMAVNNLNPDAVHLSQTSLVAYYSAITRLLLPPCRARLA